MKSKSVTPLYLNEDLAPGTKDFYNIPLMGEVHFEDDLGSGGDYSLGELIYNYRQTSSQTATLRALDNGLTEAGILYGDYLTVDLARKPRNGEIGAVKIGDRIYIRKIFYDRQFVRLETADGNSAPLIVDPKIPGFEILGKISTVIREL